MVLAAKLRAVRVALNLSQEEVARRADLSIATVRAVESGRVVEPGYFTVRDIATALNLTLVDLVEMSSD